MSRFLREKYMDMEPYTPGEQPQMKDLVKLNTNENPYPPSPKVINAILEGNTGDLLRYPDPEAKELVEAVAEYYGVPEKCVAVGNGRIHGLWREGVLPVDKLRVLPRIRRNIHV